MIFLNIFWTWQYIAMLFFVFWTLFLLSRYVGFPLRRPLVAGQQSGRVLVIGDTAHEVHSLAGQAIIGRLLWAALGTFFFHNVW